MVLRLRAPTWRLAGAPSAPLSFHFCSCFCIITKMNTPWCEEGISKVRDPACRIQLGLLGLCTETGRSEALGPKPYTGESPHHVPPGAPQKSSSPLLHLEKAVSPQLLATPLSAVCHPCHVSPSLSPSYSGVCQDPSLSLVTCVSIGGKMHRFCRLGCEPCSGTTEPLNMRTKVAGD